MKNETMSICIDLQDHKLEDIKNQRKGIIKGDNFFSYVEFFKCVRKAGITIPERFYKVEFRYKTKEIFLENIDKDIKNFLKANLHYQKLNICE